MSRDDKRRDLAPDVQGHPTFMPWIDRPTLRLDDAGKLAAQRHIAEGPSRARFADLES